MYVQEFGSECSKPNQRSVYISYIDSVNYLKPSIKTGTGEALRTFVYHELLIGYLDFIKKRGFATCYIWACPSKGDDYILYCHPKTQKTSKPKRLRKWYHSMLIKAANENIVMDLTNFHDQFFKQTREHDCKITTARLPWFEGHFCSGAVEDAIKNIEKECMEDHKRKCTEDRKRKMKKPAVRNKTLRLTGHREYSVARNKDILMMQKLEEAILLVKKDFLVIHLQCVCTHCHELILSGTRWSCSRCKNFHLCDKCHDMEQVHSSKGTHISDSGEEHLLSQVLMNLPADTKDEDDHIMEITYLRIGRNAFVKIISLTRFVELSILQ